jgi:hypothetical protein
MRAIQKNAVVRTTVGQTESIGSVSSDTSGQSVSEVNACNVSTNSDCADITNPSVISYNNNANAGSGLYAINTDFSEITLLSFKDSTAQVPLHFNREIDQYFSLKRTAGKLKAALGFRAVK